MNNDNLLEALLFVASLKERPSVDELQTRITDLECRAEYWKEIAESRWRMILMLTERER